MTRSILRVEQRSNTSLTAANEVIIAAVSKGAEGVGGGIHSLELKANWKNSYSVSLTLLPTCMCPSS